MSEQGNLTSQNTNIREELDSSNANVVNGAVIEVYKCKWAERGSYIILPNTAHPTFSGYVSKKCTAERLPGGLCEIQVSYATNYKELPDTTYVEQSGIIQESIKNHPKFSEYASDWDEATGDFKPGTPKYGITTFAVGTRSVTKTEYFTTKPSDRTSSIGKIENPGSDYSDAGHWLITESNRIQQDSFWIRQTSYLYSAILWDTDFYDPA